MLDELFCHNTFSVLQGVVMAECVQKQQLILLLVGRLRLGQDSRLTLQVLELDYLPYAGCVTSIYPPGLATR